MFTIGDVLSQAERVVDTSGLSAVACGILSDEQLLEAHEAVAHLAAKAQQLTALTSSEIARRSDRSLGAAGLSARMGVPVARDFIQRTTGGTKHETNTLLNTGKVLADTAFARELERVRESDPDAGAGGPGAALPWFSALSDAIAGGELSMAVMDAIRAGLGAVSDRSGALILTLTSSQQASVRFESEEQRAERAQRAAEYEAAIIATLPELIAECASLTPEAAQKAARLCRARVDAVGLLERTEQLERSQYLRLYPKPDGMLAVSGLLGPEYAALFLSIHEQLRHPRRAGTDFLPPEEFDRNRAAGGDLRDIEEYTVDCFMHLLKAGITVNPNKMLEIQPPAVRVVCTLADLEAHQNGGTATSPGFGILGHTNEPIPLESIERGICEGGIRAIRFDDNGESMNVGRTHRYFTPKQREALEVRDGGCMDPDCDRPVSWTEAHHIKFWWRDDGPTDLANGILLCHRDHRRYHNQGFEIERKGHEYWLIPPRRIDPKQTPRLMRSKSGLGLSSPITLPQENSVHEFRHHANETATTRG